MKNGYKLAKKQVNIVCSLENCNFTNKSICFLNTIMVTLFFPRGYNERDKDFVNICRQEETIDVDFKTVAPNASLLTMAGYRDIY